MNLPLDKFSNAAREIAQQTMTDTIRLVHPLIGTEHILFAIMGHAHNEAAYALMSMKITRAMTLSEFLKLEIPCKEVKPPIPLAPMAQKVFALSVVEAAECKSPKIGPEHFLLAMTRMPECAGMKMLENMGVSALDVRTCMLSRMGL